MKALIVGMLLVVGLAGCAKDPSCSSIRGDITEACEPTEMLVLNSNGGYIKPAITIANRVTYTHVESYCMSACVLIASAGIERTACSDAIYGLHSADTQWGTDLMIEFYEQDERVFLVMIEIFIRNTPFEHTWFLNAFEAKIYGLVDIILDCEDN